jgi:hypothetical protein
VQAINYAGTGCPAGSVAQSVSPDAHQFTLLFDSFVASAGPGVAITESRKNCQVNVQLHVPQGWSYSITTVDYRGYVSLDPYVTGVQQSTYYFAGYLNQATASTTFTGQLDQDYLNRDTLAMQNLVWSPCGAQRNLNINTSVRVNNRFNPGGQGLLTVDSLDGQVAQIYHLQWQQCQ